MSSNWIYFIPTWTFHHISYTQGMKFIGVHHFWWGKTEGDSSWSCCYQGQIKFEGFFWHIPLSWKDWWLLRFSWNIKTWIDRFLSFDLCTSPFLFDQFAKRIHWIMADLFLLGLFFNYLDDHFAVFQKLQKAQFFEKEFYAVCYDLGLSVNGEKN